MDNPTIESWRHFSELKLLDKMRSSCRMCMNSMNQFQSQVNLLTKECNGKTLMEIANELTGIQITQYDQLKSLFVCLNCAGKLVSFFEFREQCQKTDVKIDQIEKTLRLKQSKNESNNKSLVVDADDDEMQVLFNCKICTGTFSSLDKYKEHKQQHALNETSTNTSGRAPNNNAVNECSVRLKVCQDKGVAASSNSNQAQSRPRRRRAKFLNHKPKRSAKEQSNQRPSTSNSRVNGSSAHIGPIRMKEYSCSKCNVTFNNHQAHRWHDVKIHHRPISGAQLACRICKQVFAKSYQKNNHERVCSKKFRTASLSTPLPVPILDSGKKSKAVPIFQYTQASPVSDDEEETGITSKEEPIFEYVETDYRDTEPERLNTNSNHLNVCID